MSGITEQVKRLRSEAAGMILQNGTTARLLREAADTIEHLAAKVRAKTGHWIDRWDNILLCENKDCSICGYMAQTRHNYCPNCDAKMVEPQESEVSDADSN